MVFAAVLALPVITILALGVDGFLAHTAKMQQESNAEYAALAALREIKAPGGTIASATRVAENVAGLNLYIGTDKTKQAVQSDELEMARDKNDRTGSIFFGTYDASTKTVAYKTDCSSGCDAVQVALWTRDDRHYRPVFAKILGVSTVKISSSASAYFNESHVGSAMSPYYVIAAPLPIN